MEETDELKDSKKDLRLSDFLQLQKQFEKSEKRIIELESELEVWHKKAISPNGKPVPPEELGDTVLAEQIKALTYHLRAEHAKRLELEERLKSAERELYINQRGLEAEKNLSFSNEEVIQEAQKAALEKEAPAKDRKDVTADLVEQQKERDSRVDEHESDPDSSDEPYISKKKKFHNLLKESEEISKKIGIGIQSSSREMPGGDAMTKTTILTDQKRLKYDFQLDGSEEWMEDAKGLVQLLLRMGVVKSTDAALLLNKGRTAITEQAKILEEKKFIKIENQKSKDPSYMITNNLKKRMLEMKRGSRGGPGRII
ncbi:MAG: hypothetical protein ABH950_02150 [Candidatus Altiarchaeota archaeon]